MGELVSDGVLHGNCDRISGPGSDQDHIGGPTTNLVRSAHIVACGPAVPSWSPAILYRGQWSVCNFKSGANTIRGRINYSSTHDRRRYFSVGSQFCCTYQNLRLHIVAAQTWNLSLISLMLLVEKKCGEISAFHVWQLWANWKFLHIWRYFKSEILHIYGMWVM